MLYIKNIMMAGGGATAPPLAKQSVRKRLHEKGIKETSFVHVCVEVGVFSRCVL